MKKIRGVILFFLSIFLIAVAILTIIGKGNFFHTATILSKGKIPANLYIPKAQKAEKTGDLIGFITEKTNDYIVVKKLDGNQVKHYFKDNNGQDLVTTKEIQTKMDKGEEITWTEKDIKDGYETLKVGQFIQWFKFNREIMVNERVAP